jgi:hypothetical protein
MGNELHQNWEQDGLAIRLSIHCDKPFPAAVWNEDLPDLVKQIEILRLHLGGDM